MSSSRALDNGFNYKGKLSSVSPINHLHSRQVTIGSEERKTCLFFLYVGKEDLQFVPFWLSIVRVLFLKLTTVNWDMGWKRDGTHNLLT